MAHQKVETFVCPICEEKKPVTAGMPGELVNSPLADVMRSKHQQWTPTGLSCINCLEKARTEFIRNSMGEQQKELDDLQEKVNQSMRDHKQHTKATMNAFEGEPKLADRVADKVSEFVGSWYFIGSLLMVSSLWLVINTVHLMIHPDPAPYNIFHLMLSMMAALQAPIIMMSQNRMEDKERRRSEYEYRVNLRAELEVRQLHAKLDQMLTSQWQRLLEIQQIQTELMEHIAMKTAEEKPVVNKA